MKVVELDPSKMNNRDTVCAYMNDLFAFEQPAVNMDALYDLLGDVQEKTKFILTRKNLLAICQDEYAYKVLMLLGMVTEHNPCLKIVFRK